MVSFHLERVTSHMSWCLCGYGGYKMSHIVAIPVWLRLHGRQLFQLPLVRLFELLYWQGGVVGIALQKTCQELDSLFADIGRLVLESPHHQLEQLVLPGQWDGLGLAQLDPGLEDARPHERVDVVNVVFQMVQVLLQNRCNH